MHEQNNISSSATANILQEVLQGSVYFLGIGGIGMSALARYFHSKGARVSGYDKTATALTRQLEAEGMLIHYEDNIELADKDATLVLYTPAIPVAHTELNFYRDNNYRLMKRSQVLGLITSSQFNVCVAGTHGKTTTSAMLAHILRDSGTGCNAFLGGIATNYNSNFWSSPQNICVAEADEYDRSFLQLNPDVAIITSMDADHLDIYGTEENMQDAFIAFTGKIKEGGKLLVKQGLMRMNEMQAAQKLTYSTSGEADVMATNISVQNGRYYFDVTMPGKHITAVELNMGGHHNIENVLVAIAVAVEMGVSDEKVKQAVASFKGVKRRFEYVLRAETNAGAVFIDDYAHHPEELRALITSAKELYPAKKCTVVFQPHLFSRTKDHAAGFAQVLSLADEVLLLPIYPARELPVPGVTSDLILEKITAAKKSVVSKGELLQWARKNPVELFITSGAGDIDTLIEPLKEILASKN
ncbi:MAG: UDP-N-acetylmuramate--L-alanine ligase [Chitinophagaceae bacterium]|nr:MAG: UDP-N-acetylmuramate--L-alanine ligase [Chitinophagaceae bacterium]